MVVIGGWCGCIYLVGFRISYSIGFLCDVVVGVWVIYGV